MTTAPSLTPLLPPSPLPLPGTPLRPLLASATPIGVPPTLETTLIPATFTSMPFTPAFVTVSGPAEATSLTPVIGDAPPVGVAVSPTPGGFAPIGVPQTLTPNVLALPSPTLPPELVPTIADIPLSVPANPLTRAFALSTSGGVVAGGGVLLPYGGGAATFARSPVDPNQVAMVDPRGVLYLVGSFLSGSAPVRPEYSPFSVFEPNAPETNNARVTRLAYSPDGTMLAFLVDTEGDGSTQNDSINDGVWIIQGTGGARQALRECPPAVSVCPVDRAGGPFVYNSLDLAWSYQSDALLIPLDLPEEGRRAFVLVSPDQDANRLPTIHRYDSAHWAFDGRIVVSGRGLEGQPMFGVIRRDGGSDFIQRAAEIGLLWTQDAVMTLGGRLIVLGSPAGVGGPLRLYDQDGAALTNWIGSAPPERVSWSPDRSAALLVTAEERDGQVVRRFFVAEVSGLVREITAQVAGALAVEWVGDAIPPGVDVHQTPSPTPPLPSRFAVQVGARLQIVAAAGVNFRTEPSLSAPTPYRLNFGDSVLILEGPINADSLMWWKVETSTGAQGWVAESDGFTQILGDL
ncbi:MAG: SH3 domain-containing protein [Anaerolineae bacterium]|nr:SH3 domain-containing protein [Anaerolineae bacterium]NUQ05988.1 SH3 domain-containing protein [Anaerolineae bacterium]